VAEESRPVMRRKYARVYDVIARVSKVWQYCSRISVENLREKRSMRLITGFGSTTDLNFGNVISLFTKLIYYKL